MKKTAKYIILQALLAFMVTAAFTLMFWSAYCLNSRTLTALLAVIFSAGISFLLIAINHQRALNVGQNKAKSNFLAAMSHEIRTPLNAIIGISEIELATKDLPKHATDALSRIHNSGYGLLGIINDILDISKIEAGNFEIISKPYDLARLINETVSLNIVRIGSKPIVFRLNISEDAPAMLIGDELRLKQIINNLLSNAIKYTHKGSIEMTVAYNEAANALRLEFSDTGQGIKEEDLGSLFSAYTRFNEALNQGTQGTGLGLNITHMLVTMMGGHIEAASKFGQGTTFTVLMPQKNADPEKRIGKKIAYNLKNLEYHQSYEYTDIIKEYMPYGRVLVVDDVETNLFVAKGLLLPYGLSVDLAKSGEEALAAVNNGDTYHIIFLDHMMPELDGLQTVRKLRDLGYSAPIVALTANALAGNDKFFKDNGFNDYISKPIDMRQMNAMLNKYVRDVLYPSGSAPKSAPVLEMPGMSLAITLDQKLHSVFERDAKKAIVSLSKDTSDLDFEHFTITAHAMKSALSNIGEYELSKLSASLEEAARAFDVSYISAHKNDFVLRLQSLIEEDQEVESSEALDEDTAFLGLKLNEFTYACKNLDSRSCNDILAALAKKVWRNATKCAIIELEDHILGSDFDAAKIRAKTLLNEIKLEV